MPELKYRRNYFNFVFPFFILTTDTVFDSEGSKIEGSVGWGFGKPAQNRMTHTLDL